MILPLFIRMLAFLSLSLHITAALPAEPAKKFSQIPIRIVVLPYKLLGDLGNAEIDSTHKQRLEMANKTLRAELEQRRQYELVNEAASLQFSNTVSAALSNNDCNHCEVALAKELNVKQIIVPWVYRLSQLVLTMHFVILDAKSGKTILKKALDFRGDNDQSWQRAIQYFIENVEKP